MTMINLMTHLQDVPNECVVCPRSDRSLDRSIGGHCGDGHNNEHLSEVRVSHAFNNVHEFVRNKIAKESECQSLLTIGEVEVDIKDFVLWSFQRIN